ncbi:MAG: hypothetical protein AB7S36_04280, partial [Planctomycetota bacterium]
MRLAPTMIQSIEILQLNQTLLADLIRNELEVNPALEIEKPARLEETGLGAGQEKGADVERVERSGENSDDFERLSNFEADERFRDSFYDRAPVKRMTGGEDKKHEALQNTAARYGSLHDHLIEQLMVLDLTPLQKLIGEQIIYNINRYGYLRYRLENIVDMLPRNLDVPGVVAPCDDETDLLEDLDERPLMIAEAAEAAAAASGNGHASSSSASLDSADVPDAVAPGDGMDDEVGDSSWDLDAADLDGELVDADDDLGSADDNNAADSDNNDDAGKPAATADATDSSEANGDKPAGGKRERKHFVSTASGRYRQRRRDDVVRAPDIVPMTMPEIEPLRHPQDAYFEALFAEAEEVLAIIRTLEPPGVAAYHLVECLELQITPNMPHHVLLRRLVVDHLEDLQKNRLPRIARATGADLDDLKEAIDSLHQL